MFLTTTTQKLQIILGGAITTNQLAWTADYGEVASDNSTSAPLSSNGATNGGTAVDMVAAPGSSLVREILHISVRNDDTASATVTIRLNDNGTIRNVWSGTLLTLESLAYDITAGWRAYDANSNEKVTATASGVTTVSGGGTGNTSFTAYSVICAGTTSTGAFQNVVGLGTAGFVLTSNGAGTLPTWQATGGTTPGGADTNVQFNDATAFGGSSQFLFAKTTGKVSLVPNARTSGSPSVFVVQTPADTTLAASTESISQQFGGNSSAATVTRQFSTGALTTQRENVFVAPTYGFVGASTITTAVTLDITGAPVAGTNATITNAYALRTGNGNVLLGTSGGTNTFLINTTGNARISATNYGSFIDFTSMTVQSPAGGTLTLSGGQGTGAYAVVITNSGNGGVRGKTLQIVQGSYASGGGGIAVTILGAASRTDPLLQFQTSAGASLGNVSGGCVGDVFADVSTTHTDGTFDTLRTDTLVANALIANGDKIVFDYTLTLASHTTNTAEVKLSFGGVTILDTGAVTIAVGAMVRVQGYITRKSSTSCRATVTAEFFGSSTLVGNSVGTYTPDGTLTGLTLSSTNNLVLSAASAGAGAASGDIVLVQATIHVDGFGS